MGTLRSSGQIVQSTQAPIHTQALHTESALWVGEEYSNHAGTVDNFMRTNVGGAGDSIEDYANHRRNIKSGIGAIGYANYISAKTWVLNTKPLVFGAIIQNIVNGAGNQRTSLIGFKTDMTIATGGNMIAFRQAVSDTWEVVTLDGDSQGFATGITAPQAGDFVSIIAKSTGTEFYVNGVLQTKHTINIPTAGLYGGATVISMADTVTVSREIDIDYISVKKVI